MRKMSLKLLLSAAAVSVMLSACGMAEKGSSGIAAKAADAVKETDELWGMAEYMMENLKALDLEAFNGCTDNYVRTLHNWMGMPAGKEYRVFNELQQPALFKGKKYRGNYRFAQKMLEQLTWKIKDVRTDGECAEIDMEITNIDMAKVMGNYEIFLWEQMIASGGTGLRELIQNTAGLISQPEGILSVMDSMEEDDFCTMQVTLTASREEGKWKFHLSEEFINAFMGNVNTGSYPEEIRLRIRELEEAYEEKVQNLMEVWE